jgi:pilus assembly protein CpaE
VAIETLETLNIAPGHRHLLLNRADDQVGLGAEKVETILSMPVATLIPTSLDIAAATNAGTPILSANPDHVSSAALRGLAGQLTGEPPAPLAATSDRDRHHAEDDRAGRRFRKRR